MKKYKLLIKLITLIAADYLRQTADLIDIR
jgi:hypothetical protein